MVVHTISVRIVAQRPRTSSARAEAPQHPCAFLLVEMLTGNFHPAKYIEIIHAAEKTTTS